MTSSLPTSEMLHKVVGPIRTNCYMLINQNHRAAIIDPGAEAEHLLQALKECKVSPAIVLLTHGHFDHIGAIDAFADCPIYLHKLDQPFVTKGTQNYTMAFGERTIAEPSFRWIENGDRIPFGEYTFEVIHTPGHTPGCCLFRCSNHMMFTGDTLFAGEIGRCDLWGSDLEKMRQSIAKIKALDGNDKILPGHGRASTLQKEKSCNPYMIRSDW